MKNETYSIEGLSCVKCADRMESVLNAHDCISKASVNYKDALVNIEYDEEKINIKEISNLVEGAGFKMLVE